MSDADRAADPIDRLTAYQDELTRHAARMLGSRYEAEDAVQETMVRAWKALGGFAGRSQLRSWLYRICTNVCLDMLASRQRRPASMVTESHVERMTDARPIMAAASDPDPADVVEARESVRLALTAVLHYLTPKQRAALILREVLHWSASEIAELLDTSVASVNSALQRARTTLRLVRGRSLSIDVDGTTRSRLDHYADAVGSSDIEALTALVLEEAA